MQDFVDQNEIQIDRVHGGEVCMEIGERLAVALGQEASVLPGPLRALVEQLAKVQSREVETDLEP